MRKEIDIHEQSPVSLAFVGDGVFELLVRARLVRTTRLMPNNLHKQSVKHVSAHGQAMALAVLEPMLTDTEAAVLRRGKNSSKASVSKHATAEEYRASTALEALFGYLYLMGENERIAEIFEIVWDAVEQAEE